MENIVDRESWANKSKQEVNKRKLKTYFII